MLPWVKAQIEVSSSFVYDYKMSTGGSSAKNSHLAQGERTTKNSMPANRSFYCRAKYNDQENYYRDIEGRSHDNFQSCIFIHDDVLVQLKQANEKIQRQGTSLRQMRKDLDDATKQAQDAVNGFKNLEQYLRRDCLEISGVPPSKSYTCNQLVMVVGKAIGVQVKEGDISTSQPLPTFKEDAPPKIIVKFKRRDMRNSFYTNRRKLIDRKASDLPDLGITAESKVYISESLTRYKKELFGEVNKLRKKIRWKHIWTQNSRIW